MKKGQMLQNVATAAAAVILCVGPLCAQRGGSAGGQTPAPSPAPAPSPGGRTPTPSPVPTPSPTPGRGQQRVPGMETPFPERSGAIYLSGKVVMDDGTPPPDTVVIERVCNGTPRPEAYTDSKGRFSFQLGQNANVLPDASVSSTDSPRFGGPGAQMSRGNMAGRPGQITERDLMGCEIRASLPGYRSDVVNLAGRRMMDNPDVGTIVLHRMANVQGTMISATSLDAPKDARKAYDKGRDAIKKKKYEEAQKQLEKAVEIHPKYAAAWCDLGMIYQQQNNAEQARKAYEQAIAADERYLRPYVPMALLAARENKWDQVVTYTEKVTRLDPVDFPEAWYLNAAAMFNMQKLEEAEKSAREAVRLDSNHRINKANQLLAMILYNKRDYAGAAQSLKSYLQFNPNAADAEAVKKQIAEVEQMASTGQPK